MLGFDRLRDVKGNVPLPVAVWLEHDPTAVCATAVALASPWIRWHYRLAEGTDVILRGPRIDVVDGRNGERLGTARIHGFRSAGDFDALPKIEEASPFLPPPLIYPAQHGFLCDMDGQVARFRASTARTAVPGLMARLTAYDPAMLGDFDDFAQRLAENHKRAAWPIAAFTVRVRDLISVFTTANPGGNVHASCMFRHDKVIVWPQGAGDDMPLLLSALHNTQKCLGCSRHDPRDLLTRGTWGYSRMSAVGMEHFQRTEEPDAAIDVERAAVLLGRSVAELAATQVPVRFSEAQRVDPGRVRQAM